MRVAHPELVEHKGNDPRSEEHDPSQKGDVLGLSSFEESRTEECIDLPSETNRIAERFPKGLHITHVHLPVRIEGDNPLDLQQARIPFQEFESGLVRRSSPAVDQVGKKDDIGLRMKFAPFENRLD